MGRSWRFHPQRLRGVGVGFSVLAIGALAVGAARFAPSAHAAPQDNPPGCVVTLVGTQLLCLPTPTPKPVTAPAPTPTAKPAPTPAPSPCVLGLVGKCIVGGNPPPPVGGSGGPPSGGQSCTLNVLNAACVGNSNGQPVTLGPSGSTSPGSPGGGQGSPGTCLPGNLACSCPSGTTVGQACSTGPASGGAPGANAGSLATLGSNGSGLTIPTGPPLPGTNGSSFPAAANATTTAAGAGGLSHPAVTATRDLGPFSGLDLSNLALWPIFLVLDGFALGGLFLLLRRSWSTRPVS